MTQKDVAAEMIRLSSKKFGSVTGVNAIIKGREDASTPYAKCMTQAIINIVDKKGGTITDPCFVPSVWSFGDKKERANAWNAAKKAFFDSVIQSKKRQVAKLKSEIQAMSA